jgi:hypothetical protein
VACEISKRRQLLHRCQHRREQIPLIVHPVEHLLGRERNQVRALLAQAGPLFGALVSDRYGRIAAT